MANGNEILPTTGPNIDTPDDLDNKGYLTEIANKHIVEPAISTGTSWGNQSTGGIMEGAANVGNLVNSIVANVYPAINQTMDDKIESTESTLPSVTEFNQSIQEYGEEIAQKVYENTIDTVRSVVTGTLPILPWENIELPKGTGTINTNVGAGIYTGEAVGNIGNDISLKDSVINNAVLNTNTDSLVNVGVNAGYAVSNEEKSPAFAGTERIIDTAKNFLDKFPIKTDLRGTPIDDIVSPVAIGLRSGTDVIANMPTSPVGTPDSDARRSIAGNRTMLFNPNSDYANSDEDYANAVADEYARLFGPSIHANLPHESRQDIDTYDEAMKQKLLEGAKVATDDILNR